MLEMLNHFRIADLNLAEVTCLHTDSALIESMMLSFLFFNLFAAVEALIRAVIAVFVLFFVDKLVVRENFLTSFSMKSAFELEIAEIWRLTPVVEKQDKEAES
jgi:hypothetical protein